MSDMIKSYGKIAVAAIAAIMALTFIFGTFVITPSVEGKTFKYKSIKMTADEDDLEDVDMDMDDLKELEEDRHDDMKDDEVKLKFTDDELRVYYEDDKEEEYEYKQKGKKIKLEDNDDLDMKLKGNKLLVEYENDYNGITTVETYKCGSLYIVRNVMLILELIALAVLIVLIMMSRDTTEPPTYDKFDYLYDDDSYTPPVAPPPVASTVTPSVTPPAAPIVPPPVTSAPAAPIVPPPVTSAPAAPIVPPPVAPMPATPPVSSTVAPPPVTSATGSRLKSTMRTSAPNPVAPPTGDNDSGLSSGGSL
ncbi:MAG: hypothetical protein Q4B31_03275 [Clostridia bacterium]|nr:hypothetical protein [Clostridia bacterium]